MRIGTDARRHVYFVLANMFARDARMVLENWPEPTERVSAHHAAELLDGIVSVGRRPHRVEVVGQYLIDSATRPESPLRQLGEDILQLGQFALSKGEVTREAETRLAESRDRLLRLVDRLAQRYPDLQDRLRVVMLRALVDEAVNRMQPDPAMRQVLVKMAELLEIDILEKVA